MIQRRELFVGLAGLLVSPAVIRSGSLMPISTRHWESWRHFDISIIVLRDGNGGYTIQYQDGQRERLPPISSATSSPINTTGGRAMWEAT